MDISPSDSEEDSDVPTTHPNRNRDGKVDINKPAYGGT
jgi:hypothetical protein